MKLNNTAAAAAALAGALFASMGDVAYAKEFMGTAEIEISHDGHNYHGLKKYFYGYGNSAGEALRAAQLECEQAISGKGADYSSDGFSPSSTESGPPQTVSMRCAATVEEI